MNEQIGIDRRKFIGGSDIAAILGVSPWRSPVELWQRKTRDDNEPERVGSAKKALFKRGKRWESVVAEMLVERLEEDGHTVEIVATNQRYVDPMRDYFACEIDYELRLDHNKEITNCELKTVHPFAAKEWGEADAYGDGGDAVPIWYAAQAMFGLGITDRNKCIVAPLFGADEIRTYTIERDQETIDAMRGKAVEFWIQHVLPRVPPSPMVLRDMNVLHPLGGDAPALIADGRLTQSLLRMRAVDREIKAREGERDLLEFEIKKAMGDRTSVVIGEQAKEAATWKARKNSHLDQSRLKEDHPALVKEYTKKGESRVFALKGYSLDGVMP